MSFDFYHLGPGMGAHLIFVDIEVSDAEAIYGCFEIFWSLKTGYRWDRYSFTSTIKTNDL